MINAYTYVILQILPLSLLREVYGTRYQSGFFALINV